MPSVKRECCTNEGSLHVCKQTSVYETLESSNLTEKDEGEI